MVERQVVPPVTTGLTTLQPLIGGEIGVVMARAGVGKTAFLCIIALEEIAKGGRVLHICVDETPEKIRTWYEEILRAYGVGLSRATIKEMASRIEPLRFVASFLHNSFSLPRLRDLTINLSEQAAFSPSLIVFDGLDVERFDASFFQSLKTFLAERGLPLWMSARAHRHITEKSERGVPYPCNRVESWLSVVILLEQEAQEGLTVRILKDRDREDLTMSPLSLVSPVFR